MTHVIALQIRDRADLLKVPKRKLHAYVCDNYVLSTPQRSALEEE